MKFKKSISILVICSFFMFSQSNRAEANPALIVPAAIGGAALLFGIGAAKYYKPPQMSVASVYASASSLGRVVNATFTAVINANVSAATGLYSKLVTAKESLSDLRGYVDQHASEYKKLFNTFNVPNAYDAAGNYTGDRTLNNGIAPKEYDEGTGWTIINTVPSYGCYINGAHPNLPCQPDERIVWYLNETPPAEMNFCYSIQGAAVWGFTVQKAATMVKKPFPTATDQGFSNTFNTAAGSGFYDDEIDKYLTNNSGSLSIVDTPNPTADIDNAPVFVPPAAIPPSTATGSQPTTATPATNLAEARRQTATEAQQAVDTYKAAHPGATAANDPTLAELEKTAADARTAADAATGLAVQTQAQADVPLPPSNGEPPEKLNIASWSAMIGAFTQLGPFKLLSNIEEYLSQLIRPPEAPKFDLPLPLGNTMTIDLAPFDPVASLCRWFMSLLIAIGTILYAVRFWRGN